MRHTTVNYLPKIHGKGIFDAQLIRVADAILRPCHPFGKSGTVFMKTRSPIPDGLFTLRGL